MLESVTECAHRDGRLRNHATHTQSHAKIQHGQTEGQTVEKKGMNSSARNENALMYLFASDVSVSIDTSGKRTSLAGGMWTDTMVRRDYRVWADCWSRGCRASASEASATTTMTT